MLPFLAGGCLLVALAVTLLIKARSTYERTHWKGHPLAYWVHEAYDNPPPESLQEALAGIHSLSTNNLSKLVEDIKGADREGTAALTLLALGRDAAPVISALAPLIIATNPTVAERAISILGHMGPNGLPPLLQAATNAEASRRVDVLREIAFMERLGTNATAAIPVLALCAQDNNAEVVARAVEALGRLPIPADSAMPILTAALSHTNRDIRLVAVHSFANFGFAARPALTKALQDLDATVRTHATNAMRRIAAGPPPSH